MIKAVSLLTRKSSLTPEAFRKVWLEQHAPLVLAVKEVRRYVLTFMLDEGKSALVPIQEMKVDAMAELWYDDIDQLRKAAASPEMRRVLEDGALHLGAIKSFVTEEVTIIP